MHPTVRAWLVSLRPWSFPASLGPDRWDKIAVAVPGKLRAECIARYKQIVAALKAKKAAAEAK